MKKTLTFMLLLAIAGSTSADLVKKIEGGSSYVSLCPGMFTTSGKTIVYTYNENTGEVTLYTPDFEVDRTFTMPVQECTIRYFTEQTTVTPTGMNVVPTGNYYSYTMFSADSQEDMINKLAQYGYSCTVFTDPMGNFACYRNDGSFKYENLFGKQYPTEWFALIDGEVTRISTYDAFYTLAYDESTAVWEVTQEEAQTMSIGISGTEDLYVDGLQTSTGTSRDFYLTQTLFNDDEKWEYVMEDSVSVETTYYSTNISVNEDGTVTITRRRTERPQSGGYAIYNEDGTKLGQFGYPENILVINGKACIYNNSTLYVFESDNSGNIDLVEKVSAKNDRSLDTNRGIVTVDIDAEQAGGEVVVCTTDGKVMANKRVGVGQTRINGQPLPAGLYIVSLIKDGRVVESEKYLVQ